MRGNEGKEGGRKLVDESRSGSTRGKVVVRDQPSATAAIIRLFLSSLHSPPFASSSPLFFLLSRLPFAFSSPLPDRILPATPDFLVCFPSPEAPPVPLLGAFICGETRDVTRGQWLPSQPPRRLSWPETSRRSLRKATVSLILGRIIPLTNFPPDPFEESAI